MKDLINDLKFMITASNDSEVDNKIEQLILDYIKQVETEKQLLINGVVSSATSKDYTRLYDKISKGEIVPCFVDYDWRDGAPPFRDIASVKMRPDKTVMVGARGIQYGGVDSWHLETKKPLIAFTEECERMNLEYYT